MVYLIDLGTCYKIGITNNLKKAELLVIDNVDDIIGDQKVENYLSGILDERFSLSQLINVTTFSASL